MMRITVSPRFEKRYKSLPKRIKEKAKEQEVLFRKNPFAPRLKTHRLTGLEKEAWAFSINYFYRIKFIFLTDDEVLFLDVGTHEIYK